MARRSGELMPTGSFATRREAATWIEQGVLPSAWLDKGWRELLNGDVERRADEDGAEVVYSVTRHVLLPPTVLRG